MKSWEFVGKRNDSFRCEDEEQELINQQAIDSCINELSFEMFIQYLQVNGFREVNKYAEYMHSLAYQEKEQPIRVTINNVSN